MKLFLCLFALILPNWSLCLETDGPPFKDLVFPKDRKLPPGRIIGGEEVTPHAYPFQVGLFMYAANGNRYFCGGTIVARRWVLTAAHCLDSNILYVLVYIASHQISADNEDHRIVLNSTIFHFHPRWPTNYLQYDVGLVKLPTEVTFSDHIGQIEFARRGSDTFANRIGTMVGWGLTETSVTISPVLRNVNSTIMTNEECQDRYVNYPGIIVPHHICVSGDAIVGTCNGDSGGPLLVDGVQVGITSFGMSNCVLGYPSVFTRISEFDDWVAEYITGGSESFNKVHYSVAISTVLCLYQLFIYT